jgi:hypothetical protein
MVTFRHHERTIYTFVQTRKMKGAIQQKGNIKRKNGDPESGEIYGTSEEGDGRVGRELW